MLTLMHVGNDVGADGILNGRFAETDVDDDGGGGGCFDIGIGVCSCGRSAALWWEILN